MAYDYVRSIVGENPKLKTIYERLEERLIDLLVMKGLKKIETVPRELEFIVEEETLVTFNRIGAEGVKVERVSSGGLSYDYGDAVYKVFDNYREDINKYVSEVIGEEYTGNKYMVKFL